MRIQHTQLSSSMYVVSERSFESVIDCVRTIIGSATVRTLIRRVPRIESGKIVESVPLHSHKTSKSSVLAVVVNVDGFSGGFLEWRRGRREVQVSGAEQLGGVGRGRGGSGRAARGTPAAPLHAAWRRGRAERRPPR